MKKKLSKTPENNRDKGIIYAESRSKIKIKGMIQNFVIIIAALVFITCIVFMTVYFYKDYKTKQLYKEVQQQYQHNQQTSETTVVTTEPGPRDIMAFQQTLLEQNKDTTGYIKIENTNISYPVVLKKDEAENEKNEYYLKHTFYGDTAQAGAIFADYRNVIEDREQSDNIILYGHNQADNTMFGDLDKYKNNGSTKWGSKALEFYKQNPTFEFDTNYEKAIYKIIAVFVVETKQVNDPEYPIFDYQNYIEFDEVRFNNFKENIDLRNKLITGVDYEYGDKFVTLSTCSDETATARLVVIGRKVRDGESINVNTTDAVINNEAHSPDWNKIYGR